MLPKLTHFIITHPTVCHKRKAAVFFKSAYPADGKENHSRQKRADPAQKQNQAVSKLPLLGPLQRGDC